MFPFQPNNYILDFGPPNPSIHNPIAEKIIPDDLTESTRVFVASTGADLIPTTSTRRPKRLIQFGISENEVQIRNNIDARKFVHRENERQRRQEMANLCGSLRTLLPHEYVEGKRSMSDHLQGAVNYIKDMQNNIHELKARRDNLKKLPNSKLHGDNNNLPNFVTVNPCPNGVEILINTIFEEEQGFSLSRILADLCDRGFNVVSCFSTKAGERSLHRIQSEASHPMSKGLSGLQERLTCMINCPL